MDNTVVRLDIFSTGGDKLTSVVKADTEVEIKTREDKIKAETECSSSSMECPNTTDTSAATVNKESHSIFYVSEDSNTLRLDVDRNESYKIYMSASGKPSSTSYDLLVERDEDSNIWIDEGIDSDTGGDNWVPPSWDLDVKLDSQKLFLFLGAGNDTDANSTQIQVVVQQSQSPGESDNCDYITLSAANIDIVSFQNSKTGYEPVKAKVGNQLNTCIFSLLLLITLLF